MAINGGNIISYLDLNTDKYSRGFSRALQEAEGFRQKALAISAVAGKVLTAGFTVPYIAGATAASKAAISFESAFAGVKKTVDTTAEGYARLKKEIFEISRTVPMAQAGIAEIMESAGQLGVQEVYLGKFTKTIADLGVATNLAGQEGATMLAQYANVKQMPLDKIDRLGSVIVALGNNTATTEMDITRMAQALSGTAAIIKLSEADTFGLAATMASLAINTEAGGSAMSRVLQKMYKATRTGGESLAKFAKISGMSGEEFKKAFESNTINTLDQFIQGLRAIDEAGGNMFAALEDVDLTDIRITQTLQRMAGAQDSLSKNVELSNRAWQENNALTKEAAQRYSTTESRIKLAKNSINEAFAKTGEALLPVVAQGAEGVANLAQRFSELDDETKQSIVTVGGVVAAAGPILSIVTKLVPILSGPSGLIALTALFGAGLYKAFSAQNISAMEAAKDAFGNIKLSAQEVKDIIARGFPKPIIDMEGVIQAREESERSRKELERLKEQLSSELFVLKFADGDPEELTKKAKALISSAQGNLEKESAYLKANIKAFWGAEDKQAEELIKIVDGWIVSKEDQLREKGDKLTRTILDNTFSDPQAKMDAIKKGIAEVGEITAAIQAASNEANLEKLKYRYKGKGLDRESADAFSRELQAHVNQESENATYTWGKNLELLASLKNDGMLDKTSYENKLQAANEEYGSKMAEIELRSFNTFWDVFGESSLDRMETYEGALQTALQELEKNGWSELFQKQGENLQAMHSAAKQEWEYLEPFYENILKFRDEVGGKLTEDLEKKLAGFEKLKQFAQKDTISLGDLTEMIKDPVAGRSGSLAGDYKERGKKEAEAHVEGQKETMGEKSGEVKSIYQPPDVRGAFASMGSNAAESFAEQMRRKADEARRSAAGFGAAALYGLKDALEIRSPSRATARMATHTSAGFVLQMLREEANAFKGGQNYAKKALMGAQDSIQKGKQDKMLSFSMSYEAPRETALQSSSKTMTRKSAQSKSGRGRSAVAALPTDVEFALPSNSEIERLHSTREKLLALSGAHRAYYEDKAIDKELKAVEEKWTKLIEKEEAGFEALSKEQQEKNLDKYNKHMTALRKMQAEETESMRKNYDLQKRLANDFLQARADAWTADYEQRKKQAQKEDSEKRKADLEKQIRQSRSARERRELTEELERMKRDEALRLDGEELQKRINGLNALKNAVNQGVVGLGSLLNNPDYYNGAGLRNVQGASVENLSLAFQAIQESIKASHNQGGNHYTIDLTGVVVHDRQDITHLAQEFERVIRSYGRGM